jgi:hypothetical protein
VAGGDWVGLLTAQTCGRKLEQSTVDKWHWFIERGGATWHPVVGSMAHTKIVMTSPNFELVTYGGEMTWKRSLDQCADDVACNIKSKEKYLNYNFMCIRVEGGWG